jgi:hypothetical protein
MWVARDFDRCLWLFLKEKPFRAEPMGWVTDLHWTCSGDDSGIYLDKTLFPYLTWEDEPLEVTLILRQ